MSQPAVATVAIGSDLPFWLKPQYALRVGLLMAAIVAGLAWGFLRFERQALEQRELAQAELFARMLEDHANRTLDTVQLALHTVAASAQEAPTSAAADAELRRTLRQGLNGLPFLRSLSLLDAQGRVQASSDARNEGAQISLALLTAQGRSSYVPGRDLADLDGRTDPLPNARRGFIPLVQPLAGTAAQAQAGTLVAVLNPDFFANAHELALGDTGRRAALLDFDGHLLSRTEGVPQAPGDDARTHRVFQDYLPQREQGHWIGPGLDHLPALIAFRTARLRPWVLIVEQPYAQVATELATVTGWVLGAVACAWVLITLLSVGAWRSLRSHASLSAALQHTHRRTEAALAAAEQANQAKTEFLANISHELRTPLQAILGFSELGQARADAAPKLQQMFVRVHDAGDRMLALVNDLLDLSRLDHAAHCELQAQHIAPLIETVLGELQALAARKDIHLDLEGNPSQAAAAVDAKAFQQVLRNVLANALRFAPPASRITLHCTGSAAQGLQIEVRDQGPGIPAEETETIFDAFVQSSRTKSGAGGTGLGLAICRRIMTEHGGRIHARNHPDGGAVFCIELPAVPHATRAPVPATTGRAPEVDPA